MSNTFYYSENSRVRKLNFDEESSNGNRIACQLFNGLIFARSWPFLFHSLKYEEANFRKIASEHEKKCRSFRWRYFLNVIIQQKASTVLNHFSIVYFTWNDFSVMDKKSKLFGIGVSAFWKIWWLGYCFLECEWNIQLSILFQSVQTCYSGRSPT